MLHLYMRYSTVYAKQELIVNHWFICDATRIQDIHYELTGFQP